jgi:hypothetical protein
VRMCDIIGFPETEKLIVEKLSNHT